jgi:carotenoid isomerooxygenase
VHALILAVLILTDDDKDAVKAVGSIYSDRDVSLLQKLEAGQDLYPNCDASVWLRSCSQEVVDPLDGKVTGEPVG